MSRSFPASRHWRDVRFVAGLSAYLAVLSAGTASAQSSEMGAQASGGTTTHILGLPVLTAVWFILGLVLLVLGLVASSRSGHRRVVDPATRPLLPSKPVSDIHASVSAVRT